MKENNKFWLKIFLLSLVTNPPNVNNTNEKWFVYNEIYKHYWADGNKWQILPLEKNRV